MAFRKDHCRKTGQAKNVDAYIDRWTYYSLNDRIQNEDIRKGIGVANIEDEMREIQLRWFWNM